MKRTSIVVATLCAVHIAAAVTVSVSVPQEGAAMAATVGNMATIECASGTSVPLKATANAGWAFAGWYECYDAETGVFSNEVALVGSVDWRSPSANYVAGEADATLYARFVQPAEDQLSFDLATLFADLAYDFDDKSRPVLSLTNAVNGAVAFVSASLPTMTVTGLPSGLSFDKNTLRLTGCPTASGVFKVSATAKNVSGYQFSQILYVRVENATSTHVEGYDSELFVGEEVDGYLDDIFDIFNTNATIVSVALTGLPAGLALEVEQYDDESEYYVSGIPTKAGEFLVKCKVLFSDGTTETASMLYTVNGPDPFDYDGDVDFSVLEGYSVGDSILAEDGVAIGMYDSEYKVGVTGVSGLPPGVTAVRTATEYGYDYILKGLFQKAGEFTVSVKVAYEDWDSESIKTATLTKPVIVSDSPGIYLSAIVLDAESAPGCKVTGSGVYSAGATAKLAATAGRDYVFAGWCDFAGMPRPMGAEDFRKAATSVTIGTGAELEWYAYFMPKVDDYIDMGDLDGRALEVSAIGSDPFAESFVVESGSLPTLKFTNLPAGMSCKPSADVAGEYVLSYDPVTATRKPTPGRYWVTAAGTNVSRLSDTAKFLVTVLNYTDDDIHVEDDYGILTPNVAMEPISFSNVVDFARGDTLAVSGLPTGLKYNDSAAPFCLSGIPTKPGEYTLTFTGKIVTDAVTNEQGKVTYTYRNATATAFITVKDFPTITAVLSDEAAAAGNKVTGTGSFKAGTKVALKAAAAKDWVFAGWSGVEGLAALNPSLAYVMDTNDLTEVEAEFIHKRDDYLEVGDPGVVPVVKGVAFSTNLVETLVDTRSLPTVTVSGLPTGLKFDAKTFLLSGSVGKTAKAGYVYVTVAAKNASGYTFTRVVKFVVLETADDDIPEEPVLANEAGIDFSDLDALVTGGFYPQGDAASIGFTVDPATNGAVVTAVTVNGLPTGLKSATLIEDDSADVEIYGTPTKPGRYEIKVQVTYSDRKKVTSQYAFIVEDGGSGWLDVESFDDASGTVSGSGVYASGATVKLSAKPATGQVFAGWYEDVALPFEAAAEMDGVDYRTAAASFLFRKDMFGSVPFVLYGDFIAKTDDDISIDGLDEVWEIDPATDTELNFTVNSASLPKLTVAGLPKGVTLNAAAGKFAYSSGAQAQIVPGYYTVTLKAVNQSNRSAATAFRVFVANKTADAIGGLDPSADAYPLYAGVTLDPESIMPEVDVADGWKLAVAGLPAGLKLVQDKDTSAYSIAGIPTKAGTNTVTFTATKGTEKQIATITVAVAALPAWANGTYDGAYFTGETEATNAVGSVTVTISTAGKVSGKILAGGKSYSFSAASLGSFDVDATNFTAEVVVSWTTAEKESFLLSVGEDEHGVGRVVMEPTGDGAKCAEAVQNVWLRKDLSAPDFATSAKQPVLNLPEGIICKFGAKGVVTLGGKVGTVTVSGKAQTLAVSAVEGANAQVVVYAANTLFEGGAICEIVDIVLSDEDGDGKLDSVKEP